MVDLDCTRCRLCEDRTQVVPADGDWDSPVVLVGEAPGANEDLNGRPFIGKAGRMLDRLLEEAGVPRERLLITNTVKCRPPKNRRPKPDEMGACRSFLVEELRGRELVIGMGRSACRSLLGREVKLEDEANRPTTLRIDGVEVEFVPTYHPSACLFNLKAREGLRTTLRMVSERFF